MLTNVNPRSACRVGLLAAALAVAGAPAHAALIGVSGGNSSAGDAAAIIAAPAYALDDNVTNTSMEGFDEAQGITLASAITVDGGSIAAGTVVNSHMIFLNSVGGATLAHSGVTWEFDGLVLGVMSDSRGALEAATTAILGNPLTEYVSGPAGSGAGAPFNARGLESNDGTGTGGNDGYAVSGNTITVAMRVTEPGDWIRVVTAASPVPEPGTLAVLGLGLAGLAGLRRRA